MSENRKSAALILADGTVYRGVSFGAAGTVFGEIVFTTGVSGFQETLTDPSNFGQIVVQTFPLIGNYGVTDEDYETKTPSIGGLIVREYCDSPSNFRCTKRVSGLVKKDAV